MKPIEWSNCRNAYESNWRNASIVSPSGLYHASIVWESWNTHRNWWQCVSLKGKSEKSEKSESIQISNSMSNVMWRRCCQVFMPPTVAGSSNALSFWSLGLRNNSCYTCLQFLSGIPDASDHDRWQACDRSNIFVAQQHSFFNHDWLWWSQKCFGRIDNGISLRLYARP